jgi:dihydrofolate reductase
MNIRTRLCVSLDGNVTTPEGWPVQLADPSFGIGDMEGDADEIPKHVSHYGFPEFQRTCDAALMGRVTFEPALAADRWPWPDLDVFVLGSERPDDTPEEVVFDDDPQRLLEKVRAANRGGDVHLVGGPKTVEAFRAIGALDKLGLLIIPFLTGEGIRLTPAVSQDSRLTLEGHKALKGGVLEVTYSCGA